MSISAKRFSFLDQETNLGVSDLFNLSDTDPRNLVPGNIGDLMPDIDGFVKELPIDSAKDLMGDMADAAMGVTRSTKDFFTGKIDLVQAAKVGLDKITKSMFGNNEDMPAIVRQMASKCQQYMMGGLGSRKKSKKLLDCGNSKRHDRGTPCDLNLFGQLLSKMGGIDFKINMIDLDAIEKMLAGIGVQGYGIGLCNVWAAVSGQVSDTGLLGRAASTILGKVSNNFDMMAVRDIGRSLQDGVSVTAAVPAIASKIMSGFKMPSEITEAKLPGFATGFGLSMTNIDDMWNKAEDGISSIANFSNSTMGDAGDMLSCLAKDKDFSVDNISDMATDAMDFGNDDFMYAASDFGVSDAASALDEEFSSFF